MKQFPVDLQLKAFKWGGRIEADPTSQHDMVLEFIQVLVLTLADLVRYSETHAFQLGVYVQEGNWSHTVTISIPLRRAFASRYLVTTLVNQVFTYHPQAREYLALQPELGSPAIWWDPESNEVNVRLLAVQDLPLPTSINLMSI